MEFVTTRTLTQIFTPKRANAIWRRRKWRSITLLCGGLLNRTCAFVLFSLVGCTVSVFCCRYCFLSLDNTAVTTKVGWDCVEKKYRRMVSLQLLYKFEFNCCLLVHYKTELYFWNKNKSQETLKKQCFLCFFNFHIYFMSLNKCFISQSSTISTSGQQVDATNAWWLNYNIWNNPFKTDLVSIIIILVQYLRSMM